MAGAKPSFELPKIYENAGGWGPTNQVIPLQFRDIPYAPYSKGDKLGRIADWTNPDAQKQDNNQVTGRTGRTGFNRFNRGKCYKLSNRLNGNIDNDGFDVLEQQQAYGASFASAFAYTHTEDESSFSVVDNRSAAAKKMALKSVGGGQRNRPQNKQATTTTNAGYRQSNQRGGPGNRQQQGRKKYGYNAYDKVWQWWIYAYTFIYSHRLFCYSVFVPLLSPLVLTGRFWMRLSLAVSANWTLPHLKPLMCKLDAKEILSLWWGFIDKFNDSSATFGSVKYYNKAYDRVNTKNEKALQHIERIKYDTTASDDPIIQQFLQDDTASVFATDTVLALLMCATRTIHPWDIVVKKIGDKVILDKRPNGIFDYVPVNENAADPPLETDKDNLNSWAALCHEATYINQNFARQVLDPNSSLDFDKPNPFATEDTKDKLASCGYRYRKFSLSGANAEEDEEKTYLMVRTEVDAAIKLGQNNSYIMVRALNEYDPNSQGSLPWKKSLDSQRGAVVAAEMKNNAAKLARWAVQALLAGADQLKLG